jgi:hypothetical protein
MRHLQLSLFLALAIPAVAGADDWKPAPAPLMTRWASKVSPDKVLAEYPRPQMVREKWQSLNGIWQLAAAKAGQAPPFGKSLDGRILVPFPVESALSGVGKQLDRLWYRRTFKIPAEEGWVGQRVLLHFGAVNWEARVWVNGKSLGEHRGGFDGFSFDITEALKPEGEQELIVGVFNPIDSGTQPRGKQVHKPGGIFYTPSTGIWQTAWLEPVPMVHIESVQIQPNFERRSVSVTVQARNAPAGQRVTVAAHYQRKPNEFIQIPCSGELGKPITINLGGEDFRAWSPEAPFLYDLEVELENRSDFVTGYFGMRSIAVGKDEHGITRLLLNGKPYFMIGPLDQGFWPDGLYTAPTDEALKYDIEITRKLGFNTTRKHVKVEPQRWYSWCDKLGLLVWQDMPSGDRSISGADPDIKRTPESARQYETELKAMIDGLRNHPSIVMWVVFNEGWGQFDTKRITEWTRNYDPARLVDSASGWTDRAVGDVHDIHVYPGPGSPKPEPHRVGVLGEFGGLGLSLKGHLWNEKTWSYQGVADSQDLTRKYERLLRRVHELKEKPGLSAAIYTQLTDVETEANGLLTYDRAVVKPNLERVAAANRGDFSRMPAVHVIVPTAQEQGIPWRYTLKKPPDGWFKPDFDATAWRDGEAGFGTRGTPGAVVRTEWKTDDIWVRREFDLGDGPFDDLLLLMHHDEDAEVYLNGVLAARVAGFTTAYEEFSLTAEAKKALHKGKNIIAIHCHQTVGGQYIDAGLARLK